VRRESAVQCDARGQMFVRCVWRFFSSRAAKGVHHLRGTSLSQWVAVQGGKVLLELTFMVVSPSLYGFIELCAHLEAALHHCALIRPFAWRLLLVLGASVYWKNFPIAPAKIEMKRCHEHTHHSERRQ